MSVRRSLPWVVLLAILVGLSLSRGFVVEPTVPGLDPSFRYAFNYATAHRLTWGRDFVSTYGPYGYVLWAMDVGDLAVRKLAFELVLVLTASAAAAVYVWRETDLSVAVRLALLALVLYAFGIQPGEYRWLACLVLVLLVAVRSDSRRSVIAFGLAGFLGGFFLLVKFSLGFAGLLTLAVAGVLRRRTLSVVTGACAATGSFLLAWYSYEGNLAGIGPFLFSGWELTRGYSSAMSLAPEHWWIGVMCFLVWLVLVGVWVLLWLGARALLSVGVLWVPLFVAWKHTIARQDPASILVVLFGIFVMVVLLVDAATVGRARHAVAALGILLIPLLIPWQVALREPHQQTPAPDEDACRALTMEGHLTQPLRLCGLRDLGALRDFGAYRDRLASRSRAALQGDVLPASMRERIGSASVDVYPWEIAYVPANGLSWVNRPLPASFSTYTSALDLLNKAFFSSERRPEYLLWHTDPQGALPLWSIDERHLFWDEPETLRTILDTYDLVQKDPGILLLRARERRRFGSLEPLGSQTVAWNTWLEAPETSGILLASVRIEPSVVIRAIRAAFRENGFQLLLRFSSGEQARYRFVQEDATDGMWLSPFPATVDEFSDLLRSGTGRRVTAIRFHGGRLSRFYAPIVVSWYRVALADGTWSDAAR